jgi:Fe-S cluster biogenesis protein NfuA
VASFEQLADRLEELLVELDELDDGTRAKVYELLDGMDALHRSALARLEEHLDEASIARLREDPALAWLLDAYGVGVDDHAAAEAAIDSIRPYIHSHGGAVEVLAVESGVVRLKLSGSCSGCTASAITLQEGVEQALRENFPGFVALEVEEDDAPAHPPPGPTLVQLTRFDGR